MKHSPGKKVLYRLGSGLLALFGSITISVALSGCTQSQVDTQAVAASPEKSSTEKFGQARFVDITAKSGVAFRQYHGGCGLHYFVEQIASGASFLDADGDGDMDIYFPQPQPLGKCKPGFKQSLHQRLYLNDGKGQFKLSPRAFPNDTDYGIAASGGDYDNDGDVDLYVTTHGRNTLYRNRGNGTFEDVTQKAGVGLTGLSTSSVWFDADNDGFLDLYVARYCEWSVETDVACTTSKGMRDVCNPTIYQPVVDAFYRNNGNGTFTETTKASGMGNLRRRGLGVAAADFNRDGRIDLFVANDLSPNYLYLNQGKGRFREMGMALDVAYGLSGEAQANMGVAVGDYNDDSNLDVLVTTFSNQPYTLYRNNGTDFTDVSGTTGIYQATLPYLSFGTCFLDSRNSGFLDLFFANGHVSPSASGTDKRTTYKQPNQLLLNNGKGRFTEARAALPGENVRVHRGVVSGDINNDGRMDLLVTAADDRPTLLRNESQTGNWIMFKLINKWGCATPSGTQATAKIAGRSKLRVVLGGGSYAGESDHRVHYGLGDAKQIDRLEIQWTSGRKQIVENIAANRIYTIREGQAPV
jgi:hypothetical protein